MPTEHPEAGGPHRPRVAILGTAHPHLPDHLRALAGQAEVSAVYPGRYGAATPPGQTALRGPPPGVPMVGGVPGVAGSPGGIGAPGVLGALGAARAGSAGPSGVSGAAGPAGASLGHAGLTGMLGPPDVAVGPGVTGILGAAGVSGLTGLDGVSGAADPGGASLAHAGLSGMLGPPDVAGEPGFAGILGAAGLAGVAVVGEPVGALARADLALICSTTAEHPELVEAVARAGLPVLVEKPLAATAAEAEELAGRLTAAGIPVAVAMFLRHAPALRRARQLLADGRLGGLVACDARFTHPGLLDGRFAQPAAAWLLSPAWGARGAFADLGVHLVDLLHWLRPDAPLRVRSAVLSPLPAGGPGDTGGTALLEWGSVPATLHAGWTSYPGGIRLHLEGTRGTLRVDGGHVTLTTARTSLAESHRPPVAGDATTAFLANPREPASPDDAVASARVLEAIAEAAVRRPVSRPP